MPHMIEAMRINLFATLQGTEAHSGEAFAFCDSRGMLYETTPAFPALIGAVWPDWRGPCLNLPDSTLNDADKTRWSANGLKFEATPCRDLFLVRATKESPLDSLSPRQITVAELLVRGKRYKEIGRELGISPSTVTKHVNHIHEKLGIGKREDLIDLFKPER
jgi:DNA-binding CsgD family transcriptional regulator